MATGEGVALGRQARTAPPSGPYSAPVRAPSRKRAFGAESAHNEPVRRQAAYLRVSTPQQSEALQREAIQRAAAARGENVDLWFAETRARDGKERPELDSVRNLARRGELAQLWVFKLDRLAAGAQYLLTVVNELDAHGCRVVSIHEQIDTKGPWRDAILAVLGVAAQLELEAIRERMGAAKRKAEKAGKRWGRPPAADGVQRATLAEAIKGGLTLRNAAKKAGLSYGTAQRILSEDGQEKSVARETKEKAR